jgi:hypothetical protein
MKLFQPEALLFLQKKGIRLAEKRAKQGFPDYQYLVGVAYYLGTGGVVPDAERARFWIDTAAQSGHAAAQFLLGTLLMKGEWQVHDTAGPTAQEEARKWFSQSAEKKHPGSLTSMGNFITEKLIEATSVRQKKWKFWKKSIHLPVSSSEMSAAVDFYQKAIVHQYAAAYYFLGLHTLNGWGTNESYSDALRLFMEGERLGDADCAWMLGVLHEKKAGAAHSTVTPESLMWYRKAADRGNKEAQHIIGIAYLDGLIVPEGNHPEQEKETLAVKFLQQAALRGWGPSMSVLSDLYVKGWHKQKPSLAYAYSWAAKAAITNHMPKIQLRILWSKMTQDEQKEAQKIINEPDEVKEWLQSVTL